MTVEIWNIVESHLTFSYIKNEPVLLIPEVLTTTHYATNATSFAGLFVVYSVESSVFVIVPANTVRKQIQQ